MINAGMVMHATTTTASLPPRSRGSAFDCCGESAEDAWGSGEAGVDVTLAPPEASAEDVESLETEFVIFEAESEMVTRKESSDVNWPPGFCLITWIVWETLGSKLLLVHAGC